MCNKRKIVQKNAEMIHTIQEEDSYTTSSDKYFVAQVYSHILLGRTRKNIRNKSDLSKEGLRSNGSM